MFSGMLAGFLKVAAVAVVTGGFVGGIYWAVQISEGADGSAAGQGEPSVTVTVTPESTAAPTATATPQPPAPTATPSPSATAPPPTDVPPAPTLDTRVAIMDRPTLDQIQLAKDGKYFAADRGDGCMWVEGSRRRSETVGLVVSLFTDCPADFFFVFRPETGEIFLAME